MNEARANAARRELKSYYEAEARLGMRKPPRGPRVELRDEFVALLAAEGRRSVIDFGAGPATDGGAFDSNGCRYVGLDLAHGNGVLAGRNELDVIQASIDAPPIRNASFEAGWSMSTLMHLADELVPHALAAMAATLTAGAPFVIAQWGGDGRHDRDEGRTIEGEQRGFNLRTFEHNCELVATIGVLERQEVWGGGSEAWEYHVLMVRVAR